MSIWKFCDKAHESNWSVGLTFKFSFFVMSPLGGSSKMLRFVSALYAVDRTSGVKLYIVPLLHVCKNNWLLGYEASQLFLQLLLAENSGSTIDCNCMIQSFSDEGSCVVLRCSYRDQFLTQRVLPYPDKPIINWLSCVSLKTASDLV
jgi:hypothetical protein